MRIYKGSEITLKLYTRINCQSIEADKLRVVLFTTNPNNSYMVNNVVVSGDTLLVTVGRNDLNAMEDGVINYIILGYDDNEEIYNSTRQSNYYLKTPDGYVAKSVQTSKDVYIVDNGEYKVLPDEDYTSIEEVNIHVELDSENAGEIAAANAIDLVATELRTYYTKYSDNIVNPNPVTGIYPDGENFYNLANIKNIIYNTGIIPNENTKLEFWFIPDDNRDSNGKAGLVYTNVDSFNGWGVLQNTAGNQSYYASLGTFNYLNFPLVDFTLNHIVMSYADGLIVNGTKIDDFTDYANTNQTLLINGVLVANYSPDGGYGMIKITQNGVTNVIIPTEDGLKNITTDEMLEVVYNEGTYKYINNDPIILDNLIKSVDVQPKIDVAKYGIKLGYSSFAEVPDFYDFSNLTHMSNLFSNCGSLQTIPLINTSNVTDMDRMFYNCGSLQTIPELDTRKVTNMSNMFYSCTSLPTMPLIDTSNVTDMSNMFYNCISLQTIPELDTRKVTTMNYMFQIYGSNNALTSLPKIYCDSCTAIRGYFYSERPNLTDVGGWINLKINWDDNNGLVKCPNLTYQSCINVLNGLADVTELGSRTLKVHQNFIDLVGDEISIGIQKGWSITA